MASVKVNTPIRTQSSPTDDQQGEPKGKEQAEPTEQDQNNLVYWGRVPFVVAKLGALLKTEAVETEGIFRKVGSQRRIKLLQEAFELPPYYGCRLKWDRETYTVHDAACVLRRYITSLPEPLVPITLWDAFRTVTAEQYGHSLAPLTPPYPVHHPDTASLAFADKWTAAASSARLVPAATGATEHAIQRFNSLIQQCPVENRHLLLYLLDLLSVFVHHSQVNLMTASNLAVIFQPGFFYHPSLLTKPQEHQLAVQALEFLILHQTFFVAPSKALSLSSDDPRPEGDTRPATELATGNSLPVHQLHSQQEAQEAIDGLADSGRENPERKASQRTTSTHHSSAQESTGGTSTGYTAPTSVSGGSTLLLPALFNGEPKASRVPMHKPLTNKPPKTKPAVK